MSYLRYLRLFAYSGVQYILCCAFVLFFFVLCTLCCQFLDENKYVIALAVAYGAISKKDSKKDRNIIRLPFNGLPTTTHKPLFFIRG
jgi:hypothetical protein